MHDGRVPQAGEIALSCAHTRWLWVGVLLIATALRLWGLGAKALWLDEVMSLRLATQPTLGRMLAEVRSYDAHPPLYAICQFLWMRLAPVRWDTQEIRWGADPNLRVDGFARLPSVAFGVAAVAMMILVGTRLFGRVLGLVAGGLLAMSAYAVYFSQEGRPYALVLFLSLALTYVLLRLLDAGERSSPWLWLAYVFIGAASLYTYVLSFLVIAGHVVIFLVCGRRSVRNITALGVALVAMGLLFLPWLPTVQARRATLARILATGAPSPLRAWDLLDAPREWLFGPLRLPGTDVALALAALGLLVGLAFSYSGKRQTLAILAALILVPTVLYVALPMPRVHVFESKHLIFVMPPCLLLIVGALANRAWRLVTGGMLLAVAIGNVGELSVYLSGEYQKERWWALANFIREEGRAGDIILINPAYAGYALKYHYRGGLPVAGAPTEEVAEHMANLAARVCPGGHHRVILINCHSRVSRPTLGVAHHIDEHWRREGEITVFPGATGTILASIHVPK